MLFSLSFNGIKKDYLILERGKRRSAFAPIKRNLLQIPGRPGAYLESTDTEVRIIEQPIVINGHDRLDVRKLEEDLSEWLITEQAGALIFDDEPGRTYYAVVDGSLDIEDIARFGRGTITFVCPDPYKYGVSKFAVLPAEASSVVYDGSVETYPIFRATAKESITFLDIITDQGYMRIGEPYQVKETPFVREQLILNDDMKSTVGWVSASYVEGGAVAGTMASDGNDFIASSYGTGSAWHGPALKKSFSEALQDFRAEFYFRQDNHADPNMIGRAMIYLLDVNNNVVAMVQMADPWRHTKSNRAEVRLGDVGGHTMVSTTGKTNIWWNNFQGIIRLERIGKRWYVYIANRTRDGKFKHYRTWGVGYDDLNNKYQAPITQIQLHLGQYGTFTPTSQSFQLMRIYKINQKQENQIPYIAHAGDVIEIDHAASSIRINGEDRTDLKDFGASYFPLVKGQNIIGVSDFNSVDIEVEWRERFR
ncbi:distal tail protein Dit [Bacillus sp. J33]|uniref:distal tail protein Dit n=1 Tax=Bacillus sp. J33 TaxID=935836 RepID=UPI00047A056B|nr:distal tail protein Dit [Bacillus sp. J33]